VRNIATIIIGLLLGVFLSASALWAQDDTPPAFKRFEKKSWGVGIGIPYGIVGFSMDTEIAQNLTLSGGLGIAIPSGVGYDAGLTYAFTLDRQTFKPTVSAHYGVNTVMETNRNGSKTFETFTGLSLGVGLVLKNGFNLDIFYIVTNGVNIESLRRQSALQIEEPGRVKPSIGYRWHF